MVPHLTWFVSVPSRWQGDYNATKERAKEKPDTNVGQISLSLFFDWLDDLESAHIWTKDFWDHDGTIFLLELFDERREDAAGGKTGTIQGVHEVGLSVRAFITHHAASGLIVSSVRNGADFLIDAHGWNPDLDVIGSRHGVGAVTGGKLIDLEVKSKAFDKLHGLLNHFVEGGIAALFGGVLDHFDFVELIAADHTTLFGAVGTGFLTVARSIGEVFTWKLVERENLVSM